jgi:uncharacterized protein YerC
MTNISKQKLDPAQEQLLFSQLAGLLNVHSKKVTETILSELLGYEEKIMVTKRFAIVALIWKKESVYSIAKKLHVSTSTVARVESDYANGRYKTICKLLKKPSVSFVAILNTIDNILHLGGIMPHYGQTHASEAYKRARGL